ncbi:phosphate propanoyltransferase [Gracilibacillus salitolerans]|uniref:Phosphate propanoyltransferase n=1 Tax=Gracilibacillus salitolerans TaxID=2663022 RepID=A0A5Q2TN18_9BACI|nr:phosphate propanoyltransferase [Gracilibacillus salitolerans]QGH35403.1 phosphate propanoyltransferase [Gracilibacillus salitolerans]
MKDDRKSALYLAITEAVMEEIKANQIEVVQEESLLRVPVSISARHVHLEKVHADILFGKEYEFQKHRDISQPGQYACVEQVTIVGPKSSIERVRIVAPLRRQTQVEVSRTDAIKLGIQPPVRHSGDVAGSAPITIIGPKGKIHLKEGCIIADRHIHMSPADANTFGVANHQKVQVEVDGEKAGVMGNVTIRVSERYALDMHIDTDDANAFAIKGTEYLTLIK